MVKATNKTLAQLYTQEKSLEKAIPKYNNSPRLVRAERITEQQIKAKGGNPNNSSSDKSARMAALKRRMKKGKGFGQPPTSGKGN